MPRHPPDDDYSPEYRKKEKIRLRRRGRPKVASVQDPIGFSIELYNRAKQASKKYRDVRKAAMREKRFRPGTTDDSDMPSDVRKAADDTEKAWNKWNLHGRTIGGIYTRRDDPRLALRLPFPSGSYQVKTGDLRRSMELREIWGRHVFGRPTSAESIVVRVGVLHEFGDLLDPPVEQSYKALAKRFKKSVTTIQSYLRRYRKITSDRSML